MIVHRPTLFTVSRTRQMMKRHTPVLDQVSSFISLYILSITGLDFQQPTSNVRVDQHIHDGYHGLLSHKELMLKSKHSLQ